MAEPTYATVEQLAAASDYKPSAFEQDRLKRLLDAASRRIEQQLHRHFYPVTAAYTYTSPPIYKPRMADGSGFFLDRDLLSISAATQDGTSATVADIDLFPGHFPNEPASWAELTGGTIVITGDWGYSNDTAVSGALDGAMSDTTGTAPKVTDSNLVGVGDLIIIDSERLVVTDKLMVDLAQNTTGSLTADTSDVTVAAADGSVIFAGETLLIDAEKMLVLSISGNNLTVKRAWAGTVLASHSSGADIFAPRTLTVERGSTGSTAATHLDAAAITRNLPPGPITDLCLAEALTTYEQEASGFARGIGDGEGAREVRNLGLLDVRREAKRYIRPRSTVAL